MFGGHFLLTNMSGSNESLVCYILFSQSTDISVQLPQRPCRNQTSAPDMRSTKAKEGISFLYISVVL